jgi:hypothetical protein
MREYRKRIRVDDNCNNVPKRIKLYAERQHEYRESHINISAENMRNYRKRKTKEKAHENKTPRASTSTDTTPTPIIYNYDHANEYFKKKFICNPFGYACDICDRLWYMNDLKKENT